MMIFRNCEKSRFSCHVVCPPLGGECFAPSPSPRGSSPSFYLISNIFLLKACSTSLPSGNLVGGLPLVEHTGEDVLAPARIHNNVWDGHA